MEKNGIAVRVVPTGFLLPLLEACGDIEDEELEELWARLLASGVEGDSNQHPSFVDTLRRLDRTDAEFLARLAAHSRSDQAVSMAARPTDARSAARLVALGVLFTGYQDPKKTFGSCHIFVSEYGFQLMDALRLLPPRS